PRALAAGRLRRAAVAVSLWGVARAARLAGALVLLLLLLLHRGEVMAHRALDDALLADRPDVGGDPVEADAGGHAQDERDEDHRHAGEQDLLLAGLDARAKARRGHARHD